MVRDKQGKIIFENRDFVGLLEVIKIEREGSKCSVIKKEKQFEIGDEVFIEKDRILEEREIDRGSVKISSNPENALVSLSGEVRGKTPLLIRNIPKGTYIFEITKPEFHSKIVSVEITKDKFEEIGISLDKKKLDYEQLSINHFSKMFGFYASIRGAPYSIENFSFGGDTTIYRVGKGSIDAWTWSL